ncbi:MAG: arginine repressor [Lachnospiraceae bacterium]|nr:arginine repressor [Lachnospiraceae bacterium]
MKIRRHDKIRELISKYEIETQEELAERLNMEGFNVTQATISRDIRELKLTKLPNGKGRQCYTLMKKEEDEMKDKFIRIFCDGYVSMDMAQNILVIKTVSGLAMAVAAALDGLHFPQVVGTIAGDDTIMCAVRSVEDTVSLMKEIQKFVNTRSLNGNE